MKISFLGHSQFIVELENSQRKTVRILNDVWLTDFAFGDFLQRNPTWNFSDNFLGKLDFIYISHPHCDHLDPYSLFWIYQKQNPEIILPENLSFLVPLFKHYLPKTQIHILKNQEPLKLEGITFLGRTFNPTYETNERDVMTLFISNDREVIFIEEDCAIPDEKENHEFLYRNFVKKQYENRIYLAIRNELEGFFLSTDEQDTQKRKEKVRLYIQKRKKEIEWEYEKFLEYPQWKNIYRLKNFIKIYIGQGMIYPIKLSKDLLHISAPFSLETLCKYENQVKSQYSYNFATVNQEVGYTFEIQKGKVIRKSIFSFTFEYYPTFFRDLNFIKIIQDRPVFNHKRNREEQTKILELLLNRFFVYLTSNPQIPVIDLFKKQYSLKFLYGDSIQSTPIFYQLDFSSWNFRQKESLNEFYETYWLNDIEDFYKGKLDVFSSTLLNLKDDKTFYFWTMLGLPFLNNDIVYNKIKYHFERAFSNQNVEDYVLPIILDKIKIIKEN